VSTLIVLAAFPGHLSNAEASVAVTPLPVFAHRPMGTQF